MTPELSFVIVNWNGGQLLRRAIESVISHPPHVTYDIVVVDNASSDDSVSWLRSPELTQQLGNVSLKVVENPDNLGFGKANNQGFQLTSAPLLFLLNPDAELTAGSVDTLIKTLKSDDRIGMCGPRIINPDGSLQISVWRNPPTAWATLLSGTRLCSLLPKRVKGELLLAEHWDHSRRLDVGMLSGAALLVRREVIDDVGGFDERFHMYGEDNEWCLRVKRSGWRLVFEPDALVVHHGGHSSLRRWTDLEKLRVQTNAYLLFLGECLSRSQVITNLTASVSLLSLQRLWRKLRNRSAADVEIVWSLQWEALRRTIRGQR